MAKQSLIEWLKERRDNAMEIAESKTGDDRKGWIEDAEYFQQAIEAVGLLGKVSR